MGSDEKDRKGCATGCVTGCLFKLLGDNLFTRFVAMMLDPRTADNVAAAAAVASQTAEVLRDEETREELSQMLYEGDSGPLPYQENRDEFMRRHAEEQATEEAPCPSCQRQLRAVDWQGVLLHDCDRCRGLWMDERLLGQLFEAEPPESLINPSLKRLSPAYKTESGHRKCPKCRQTLDVKNIVGVPIERCGFCKGAWLDHGEFHSLRSVWLEDPGQTVTLSPFCGYCDLENEPEARRCESCGAPLARRQL